MRYSRAALGLASLPGGVLLTAALGRDGHRLLRGSSTPGGDPAAAVAGLAATGAALIAAWLTLCLALTLCAELPGAVGRSARRLRDRLTPLVVRRWAAIVLGASLGATVLPGTAVAAVRTTDPGDVTTVPAPGWSSHPAPTPTSIPAPGFAPSPPTGTRTPPVVPTPGWSPSAPGPTVRVPTTSQAPGWLPTRPPARHRTDAHLLTGRQRAGRGDEESVVVRRGDTLWSIAAARLGPDATEVEIARAWPRWHAANASAIGADPHTLLPGTRLTPPPTE